MLEEIDIRIAIKKIRKEEENKEVRAIKIGNLEKAKK